MTSSFTLIKMKKYKGISECFLTFSIVHVLSWIPLLQFTEVNKLQHTVLGVTYPRLTDE